MVAAVGGLLGCGGAERIGLDGQVAGGELVLTLHGMGGVELALLAGRPWQGNDSIPAAGLMVGLPAARLMARSIPAGEVVSVRLRAKELRALPDPLVLQVVATEPGSEAPIVASSRALVVRRVGPQLELSTPLSHFLQSEGGVLLLGVVAPLMVAWGLHALRWPSRWRPRWGALLVGGAVAALVIPRAWSHPDRREVEQGWVAPPLTWPTSWSLGDDPLERTLGPGFQRLVAMARDARRTGEPLTVWSSTVPDSLRRATYLAHALEVEARVGGTGSKPSGLCIFTGLEPSGTTLFSGDAGVLARVTPP